MKAWRSLALALLLFGVSHVPSFGAQSGCLPVTGTYSGVAYAQLINAAFGSLLSSNSGAQPPKTDCSGAAVFGQYWLDTSASVPWLRFWSGNKWLAVAAVDAPNGLWEPPIGGGVATLPAASVTDLCATPESSISIVGATTINSFGTACTIGQVKLVSFASVLTLAHAPDGIVLPGGAGIATQVGDTVVMNYVGGGIWRAYGYARADGSGLAPTHFAGESITMRAGTCPAGTLPEDGRSLPKSTYPQLTAALGTTWGGTDTTINLPDTRGNFERGWGAGQSVDAGRAFGGVQDWLVADHSHNVYIGVTSNFSTNFSAPFASNYRYGLPDITNGVSGTAYGRVSGYTFYNETFNGTINGNVSGSAYGIVSGNTGGMNSGGGNENRPRNITAYRCIFTRTF